MAKSSALKKHDEQLNINDIFNFQDTESVPGDEMLSSLMQVVMDASIKQTDSAIELTKVVLNKLSKEMTEEEIFAIFKKSIQIISESNQLKGLWEKLASDMN